MTPVELLKEKISRYEEDEKYILDNENSILPICTMEAFGIEQLSDAKQFTNKVDYVEDEESNFAVEDQVRRADLKDGILNTLSYFSAVSSYDAFPVYFHGTKKLESLKKGMSIVLKYGLLDGKERGEAEVCNILEITPETIDEAMSQLRELFEEETYISSREWQEICFSEDELRQEENIKQHVKDTVRRGGFKVYESYREMVEDYLYYEERSLEEEDMANEERQRRYGKLSEIQCILDASREDEEFYREK